MKSCVHGRPHSLGRPGALSLLDSTAEAGEQVLPGTDAEPQIGAGGSWYKVTRQELRSLESFLHHPMNGCHTMTDWASGHCISLSLSFLYSRRG